MGSLSPLDLFPVFQIPIKIQTTTQEFSLNKESLPKQYIDGTLRIGSTIRCTFAKGTFLQRGGYGKILLSKRTDLSGVTQQVCIKAPHVPSFSVCAEAIIQWLASTTLKRGGIVGAIPEVYDIFQYAGETRFSMSYIEGISSIDYIQMSSDPERAFLEVVLQVSFLLGYLEETMYLDHRDLKADNVWIRLSPVKYTARLGGKLWTLQSPVQVVLLDFGFSCIGTIEGTAVVSLSDGILPRMDPCPKEGRDVFQLISSLWSLASIRAKMSPSLVTDIEHLLSYKNKPYSNLIRQTTDIHWTYLLVSDLAFHHPPLHPISLLQTFRIKYPHLILQCE